MKKSLLKILLFAFIFVILSLSLASCGKDKFEIRFVVNGEVYHSVVFSGNGDVEMPEPPTLDAHIFDGWFLDSGKWSVPFDEHYFNDKNYSVDLSVYAKMTFVHEHTPGDFIIQKQSTCETEGLQIKKCTQCDDTVVSQTVEKAAHKEVVVSGIAATDTTDGYTDGGYCSVCNSITRSQQIIPARIHGTQIDSEEFSVDGPVLSLTVPNSTINFSILDSLKIYSKAKIALSYDEAGNNEFSDLVELSEGDNLFYATVSFANESQKYSVNIYRRHIYTVSFDTNNGTQLDPVSVEEGSLAVVSQPTKAGYTFAGWDYDFTTPITQNITAKAKWTPNANTSYKVIYYIEDVKGDFSVYEEKSYTGTTDVSVNAELITIDGYEYSELLGQISGIVASDGSLVLKVYYIHTYFTVSFNTNCDANIEAQKLKNNSLSLVLLIVTKLMK